VSKKIPGVKPKPLSKEEFAQLLKDEVPWPVELVFFFFFFFFLGDQADYETKKEPPKEKKK